MSMMIDRMPFPLCNLTPEIIIIGGGPVQRSLDHAEHLLPSGFALTIQKLTSLSTSKY